jgi:hypothetical protein
MGFDISTFEGTKGEDRSRIVKGISINESHRSRVESRCFGTWEVEHLVTLGRSYEPLKRESSIRKESSRPSNFSTSRTVDLGQVYFVDSKGERLELHRDSSNRKNQSAQRSSPRPQDRVTWTRSRGALHWKP